MTLSQLHFVSRHLNDSFLFDRQLKKMKSVIIVLAVAGLAAGYAPLPKRGGSTTEKTPLTGKKVVSEKPEVSPLLHFSANQNDGNGLREVSEEEIPDGVPVYVMEESPAPREKGESMSTADNLVFRPLFQYRNRQEALARRRNANGYRRRYFVQRRPYRNVYNQYYSHRWH